MRHRYRSAFSMIELLVVIGIIGVLIALLVPAVQKVRSAAARVKCANNLRQLGLAAHQYHDNQQSFPAGMRYQNKTDPYPLMSWLTQLLPYMEQQSLWSETLSAYQASSNSAMNPPHIGLTTIIAGFGCPADPRVADVQVAQREKIPVALTSYLGVEGKDLFSKDGILFTDSAIRIADVTDGTSQTLLAGERPPSADFQFGWWYAGSGQGNTGSGDMILGVEELNVLPYSFAPCPSNPSMFGPGTITNQCDLFHFWSLHSGGANFLFADGSVHFLSYSAAPLLPALASRNGGETAELP